MSSGSGKNGCGVTERVLEYTLRILPLEDAAAVEEHIAACPVCRTELESLRPVVASFVHWPTDVLRSTTPLWDRLSERIGAEAAPPSQWTEPEWEEPAPGIFCKLLATDTERHRVSMLVKLAPGVAYPPHRHGGLEELHLLDGELMIGERKLYPGDYNRALAGTEDHFVWSETGCTCVLIASTLDELR